MQPIEFIAYYYYGTAYYCFFLVVCWMTTIYYVGSNTQKILHAEGNPSQPMTVVLTVLVSFFLGLRQLKGDFGDTISYAHHYERLVKYASIDFNTEWLFENFQFFSKTVLGLNVHEFFVLDCLIYFGCMLICSVILVRQNLWLAMLFFFTGFQTYSFGVNGLRNGLACSMVLVAISLLATRKKHYVAIALMLMAFFIHRSSMLPTAMAVVSLFFIKNTRLALRFWYASIVLSLFAGPVFEQFFASLGFDDRMSTYTNAAGASDTVLYSGFRFDFLFYSAFPVWMIWYVTQRRKFNSPEYSIFANTYLLCNAFWILVIRASFSNRFAYLSWFLYPIVIAYPLMRMNLWKDQDRKTAIIFFFYTGFTFFMFFVYYFGTTGFRGFDQYWWRER